MLRCPFCQSGTDFAWVHMLLQNFSSYIYSKNSKNVLFNYEVHILTFPLEIYNQKYIIKNIGKESKHKYRVFGYV